MKRDERQLIFVGILLVLLEVTIIFGSIFFIGRSIKTVCNPSVAKCSAK